ncbi:MAG: hypothetical protein ACM3Y9_12820 [Ignavibacteria bacterium]
MNFGNQERGQDMARAGQAFASNYQTVVESWVEVSRCCMAAADDIYQTSMEYVKDQTQQLQEISRDPGAAMREENVSKVLNCSFDAADRIAQAYLHSIENVREPLMRAVTAQLPMGRTITGFMEQGMQRGLQTMREGAERMEQETRGAARSMERGAEETKQHQQHQSHSQGRSRKSA